LKEAHLRNEANNRASARRDELDREKEMKRSEKIAGALALIEKRKTERIRGDKLRKHESVEDLNDLQKY
jgi:hypothetical protein